MNTVRKVCFGDRCAGIREYVRGILSRHYVLDETADAPDYYIDNGCWYGHVAHDACVKIAIIAENCVPDFNAYDYAVGFDPLTFGDRYLRQPLFARCREFPSLENRKFPADAELLNRDFCSMVVSNGANRDPVLQMFLDRIEKYKPVLSGGGWRNNVGGRVPDKVAFCRGCKFNLAFENSASPGYTTEKILDAYLSYSVPVYFGNPQIDVDFHAESMVCVKSKADVDRAVEEVMWLDSNPDAYLRKVKAPCLVRTKESYDEELEGFLAHVFSQPKEQAFRRCMFGYQATLRQHNRRALGTYQRLLNLHTGIHKTMRRIVTLGRRSCPARM